MTAVTPDEVRATLAEREQQLHHVANQLWPRIDLGNGCRIFPGIARATARQLSILRTSFDHPIEVSASACRLTFELNLLCRYALASNANLLAIVVWRAHDEIAMHKGVLRLSNGSTPQAEQCLNDRIRHIEQKLRQHNLTAAPHVSPFKMAEAVNAAEEYKTFYSFYSKYVHASAWLALTADSERDCYEYRQVFIIQSQIYALDIYNRTSELLNRNG